MEDTSLEDFLDTGEESSEGESESSEPLEASEPSEPSEPSAPAESAESAESAEQAESADPAETDSQAGDDSAAGSPDVEPAEVTARWAADGRCCNACGSEVNRLWTDGETDVCLECKNWE